jgi:type IV secretory pathway VirB2 component (pilin)
MHKAIRASLLFLLVSGAFGGTAARSPSNQARASGMETDVAKVKETMLGNWESKHRPGDTAEQENPDGGVRPSQ